ncbi:hypothetical protein CCAX7_51590 [Capsulimonas corticalis]|uniref:Uncharacterized protein n=1 Tax=Capsulimonas corticalis TaxID=2219043 RepID=A0A402CP80_9BACT|nr:hypothetical protein [Capsulimonas corticalis]BDI33108.1 hypothetical protein CCAX7_51590 [Capsulimonas corticalis]
MTQYDLAGNPLPNGGASQPQYDLAGNPIAPQGAPMGGGGGAYAPPGMGGQAIQYDLAGNPLPVQQAPPSYGNPAGGPPPMPGQQPYGAPGQRSGPYGGPQQAAKQSDKRGLGVGIGIVLAVLVAGGVFLKIMMPSPVPAPTSFTPFVAPNKDFQVQGPTGWDTVTAYDVPGDSSSDSTVGGVKFKSGPAFIDVTTDSVAQIRNDILLNGAGAAPDALFGSQAAYEQKRSKSRVSSILKNYQEKPMPAFASPMGESAIAEYTADGPKIGIGPKVHGYRMTTVGPKIFAIINCQCPEADWQTLKPAFVTSINSIADGNAAPPAP